MNDNVLRRDKNRNQLLPSDLRVFIEFCSAGTLYDYLMKQVGWTADRNEFKEEFFHMLYGQMTESPMTQVMQREFPSVMDFIYWHKRRHGYKELSREMQRAESKLMIETVCGNLMEQNREIPLVTVHDSIMTTPEFVPVVRVAIAEAFGQLGILPTVKTKGTTFKSTTVPPRLADAGSFNPWEVAA